MSEKFIVHYRGLKIRRYGQTTHWYIIRTNGERMGLDYETSDEAKEYIDGVLA